MIAISNRRGFTLIELLIVIALIGILSALSAPFLLAARASANAASAVQSLRALNSGQATFATVCGSGGYTLSLATLVSERYASPDLDITPKSGYRFALLPANGAGAVGTDCLGQPTHSGFYFMAEPLSASTGTMGFAITHVGTIWRDTTGAAPTEPFTPSATVAPYDGR